MTEPPTQPPKQPPAPPRALDLADMIGGRRGVIDASVPGVALVVVDTFAPLGWAIGAALVAALAIAVLRRVRGEPLRQAGMGVFGLAGAAAASIAAGRPLLGYAAALLDRGYAHWRDDPRLRRAAAFATAMWAFVFALRACVQGYLYTHDEVNWLAPVRLGMGLPLAALAFAGSLFVLEGRRRESSVTTPPRRP